MDAALASFEALTDKAVDEMDAKVDIYATNMMPGEMVWIPPGYSLAERSTKGPVVYGLRKSVFPSRFFVKADVQAVVDMMDKDNKPTQRLKDVIALIPDAAAGDDL